MRAVRRRRGRRGRRRACRVLLIIIILCYRLFVLTRDAYVCVCVIKTFGKKFSRREMCRRRRRRIGGDYVGHLTAEDAVDRKS